MVDIEKEFEEIAKEVLGIETLETRYSDSLDFYDVAVWGIKEIMYRAYNLDRD